MPINVSILHTLNRQYTGTIPMQNITIQHQELTFRCPLMFRSDTHYTNNTLAQNYSNHDRANYRSASTLLIKRNRVDMENFNCIHGRVVTRRILVLIYSTALARHTGVLIIHLRVMSRWSFGQYRRVLIIH
jgi:hypothetical protein